ncbi:MAG: hypothetical protein VYB37_06075 [Pseudomonadota bacterium]|nr:hypothetical protein [Pseudomonadota bacterium]
MKQVFPWHHEQLTALAMQQDRLPPGLMICGNRGAGKLRFSLQFARDMLCSEQGSGCGQCKDCTLVDAGHHPDLHVLTSSAGIDELDESLAAAAARYIPSSAASTTTGRSITVDQVRKLINALSATSHRNGPKVVLVVTADAMNRNAANAVLKVLEEPTDDTFFVLLASLVNRIPATVRSRCVDIVLTLPQHESLAKYLKSSFTHDAALITRCIERAHGVPELAAQLLNALDNDRETPQQEWLKVLAEGNLLSGATIAQLRGAGLRNILPSLQKELCRRIKSELLRIEDGSHAVKLITPHTAFHLYSEIGRFLTTQSGTIDEGLFLDHISGILE